MNCRSNSAEIWKDIPGFAGRYQASTDGRVRAVWPKSGKTRVLQPYKKEHKKGANRKQLRLHLTLPNGKRREYTVIKLIADTFFPPHPDKCPVHRNGIHTENYPDNIIFLTREEMGQRYGAMSARRPVSKINENGEILETYSSARAAAKENYLSYQAVMDRCNRKIKKEFALGGCSFRWDD